MALGDSTASDKTISTQASDAGAAQQQHDLAGVRMSSETNLAPAPPGNTALVASLPEVSIGNPGAAGTTGTGDSPAGKMDKTKSVGQLISAGVFQPADAPAGGKRTADAPAQALKPGESPQVTVTYADANTGANQKAPDFIVKQDGTIQASGDPSAANKKDVVIQVERAPGSVSNPDANQQQSIDGLVTYLKDRYSADNPTVAQNGLKLNDQYGLISDNVAQQVAAKPTAPDAAATTAATRQNFAPQTQGAMSQASRFTPGSSGQVSRGDIDNIVPERTQPRVMNETEQIADIKNAIAAEFKPDAATTANPNAPYETSRMDRVGTATEPAVGRYGMSYNIFRGWFAANCGGGANFDFDDDTIAAQMDSLAKHGKVSKAYAAKFHDKAFAHRFVTAMHNMKAGVNPSPNDMKDLLPAQFQEQVSSDMVGQFAKATGGDVGKTALAFHLGKSPDQVTAPEFADAGNKEYQRTANTFASASHLRDSMGPTGKANYTVSQDGSLMDAKIKQAAMSTASNMHSEGWCARGVHAALAAVGISETSGDAQDLANNIAHDSRFVPLDRASAMEAVAHGVAVVVHRPWTEAVKREWHGQDIGHIAVLTGVKNGQVIEASDHVSVYDKNNPRYVGARDTFYALASSVRSNDVQNA